MKAHHEALTRTTLLLNREFFDGRADEHQIADALLASTVRLVADRGSLASRAGQGALVSAVMLVVRLGISVELVAPNVALLDPVAPLRLPHVVDALCELGGDLVPGATVRTSAGEVDETFALGAAVALPGSVRVAVSDFAADLERTDAAVGCAGQLPFGGFAAGAAIAAVALEAALPRIASGTGLVPRSPRPSAGPPVRIRLLELFPGLASATLVDLGQLDAVSGGAITHALLFCLARIPGLRAHVRVIEDQAAELSNVNRYALLRASEDGLHKIEQLERVAAGGLEITGVRQLFTKETRERILPLAERVVVGVDDVRARWWVQDEHPAWLAIGATGNHLAQLTTHPPGKPCAACLHSEPLPPQTIPTISFVSFCAGLLQACALVSESAESRSIVVHPFALGGPSGATAFEPAANPACPIRCPASQRAILTRDGGTHAGARSEAAVDG